MGLGFGVHTASTEALLTSVRRFGAQSIAHVSRDDKGIRSQIQIT